MNVKYYKNRFGGFGIVPTDSTMIGDAVDLACCRTEKQAEELVRNLNSHDALLAALQYIVAWSPKDWSPEHARDIARQAIAKATGKD